MFKMTKYIPRPQFTYKIYPGRNLHKKFEMDESYNKPSQRYLRKRYNLNKTRLVFTHFLILLSFPVR